MMSAPVKCCTTLHLILFIKIINTECINLGKLRPFGIFFSISFSNIFFCLYLFDKYPLKLSNFAFHLLLLFIFCVLSNKERRYRQYIIGQQLTSSQIIAIEKPILVEHKSLLVNYITIYCNFYLMGICHQVFDVLKI